MRVDRDIIPWVAGLFSIMLYYPWCYELIHTLTCKNGGRLNLWRLECDCPFVYSGTRDCSRCIIDPERGTCGFNGAARYGVAGICKGSWVGDLCDECHNTNVTRDKAGNKIGCSGECRNDLGFYQDEHGRCTIMCTRETRCNGHGSCVYPDGHCKCDDGYSSVFTYSVSQYGSECAVECPYKCEVNGISRGRCKLGSCKCDEGYTGIGCQKQCPKTANGICNGHGYCDFEAKCRCDVDSSRLPVYVGTSCQYKCPVSSVNGMPCGSKDAKCVPGSSARLDISHNYGSGDALCICPTPGDAPAVEVPHVCNCNCNGHGTCVRDGCRCNAGWNPLTDCRTCAPHYFSFGTGCTTFCKSDVTCGGLGKCAVSSTGDAVCLGCDRFNGAVEPVNNPTEIIKVFPGDATHKQIVSIPFQAEVGETMLVQVRQSAVATTRSDECIIEFAGITVGANQPCSVPNSVCGSTKLGRLCCVDGFWKNGDCTRASPRPIVTACEPEGSACKTERVQCHPIDGDISCCFDGQWRKGPCQYDLTEFPWDNFTTASSTVNFSQTVEFTHVTPQYSFIPTEQYSFFMVNTLNWSTSWSASTTVENLKMACSASSSCRGFSILSHLPFSALQFTCVSETLTGCGPKAIRMDVEAGIDTYAKQDTATLQKTVIYDARGVAVINRGCNRCEKNWYPSPEYAKQNGLKPCVRFCDPASTCGQYGTCSSTGECECMQTYAYFDKGTYIVGTNLDKKTGCQYCMDGYYPDPVYLYRVNFEIPPCSKFCDHGAIDNSTCNANFAPSGCMYCSKHGFCEKTGDCSCVNNATGLSTGFFGTYCDDICRPQDKGISAESCSGHGECRRTSGGLGESICECDEGYFGINCNYTASRPDQFYYYSAFNNTKTNAFVSEAEFNADTTGDVVRVVNKTRCNGGKPDLTVRYTMSFTGGGSVELFNETCTIDDDDNVMSDPPLFSCCFGHNNPQYANSTKQEKTVLMQKFCDLDAHNVFCNVNELVASDDKLRQTGKCSTVFCDCTQAQARFSDHTNKYESQFAGPGCQLVDCSVMSFQVDKGTFIKDVQSICGRHPPDDERGACIRGECVPQDKFSGADGMTFETPTPSRNAYAGGRCQCNQDALLDPIMGCGSRHFDDPMYTEHCCARGEQPYSGASCNTFCSCSDITRGSCQTTNLLGLPAQGMACYCRQGSQVEIQRELFCGASCDVQCNGIVDTKTGKTDIPLTYSALKYCPILGNKSQAWKVPALSDTCYSGLAPCNNHGKCANSADGGCYFQNKPGACACDGYNVPLKTFLPDSKIPGRPSLFTGENCQFECPRKSGGQIMDFYNKYNEVLDTAEAFPQSYSNNHTRSAELRDLTMQYYDLYVEEVCSGHGYCDNSAATVYAPQCICFGDYGGADCSKACSLETLQINDRKYSQQDLLEISNRFGVQACGPRSKCAPLGTGVACTQMANVAELPLTTLQTALQITVPSPGPSQASQMLEAMTALIQRRFGYAADAAEDIILQFPTVWFASGAGNSLNIMECVTTPGESIFDENWSGFYTKGSGSLIENGLSGTIRVPGESAAIIWQSKRTCDGECLREKPSSTDDYTGPGCCNKCVSDWMAPSSGSYGGCVSCSTFATGRECNQCLYGFKAACIANQCLCDVNAFRSQCSQCSGAEYVYPTNNTALNFPTCMPCMGAAGSKVCSGNGQCRGSDKTFGSAQLNDGQVSATSITDLTSQNENNIIAEFTQCQCSDAYDGATCAVPKTSAGCNAGVKSIGGWCDCFETQSQTWFSGMYCEGSKVLNSAENVPTYPTHIINNNAIICGGHGSVVNGACVCDIGYDAGSGCIEVVDSVKSQRQWDVCMCLQYGRFVNGAAAIEACVSEMPTTVDVSLIETRSCEEAAAAVGRII